MQMCGTVADAAEVLLTANDLAALPDLMIASFAALGGVPNPVDYRDWIYELIEHIDTIDPDSIVIHFLSIECGSTPLQYPAFFQYFSALLDHHGIHDASAASQAISDVQEALGAPMYVLPNATNADPEMEPYRAAAVFHLETVLAFFLVDMEPQERAAWWRSLDEFTEYTASMTALGIQLCILPTPSTYDDNAHTPLLSPPLPPYMDLTQSETDSDGGWV